MPGDDVPAELVAELERLLQIELRPLDPARRGARQRLVRDIDREPRIAGLSAAVDVSAESVSRTAPRWEAGARLNLEQALKLGDELGGHIVTGHVDGVGEVLEVRPAGDSVRVDIAAPRELAPYLASKGSVTIDGVSLTINEVVDRPDGSCRFAVNIIPHTSEVTTLGGLEQGERVNLEIDVLARYLKRLESLRAA